MVPSRPAEPARSLRIGGLGFATMSGQGPLCNSCFRVGPPPAAPRSDSVVHKSWASRLGCCFTVEGGSASQRRGGQPSMVSLKVNGVDQQFDGDPNMPLLWYLRD